MDNAEEARARPAGETRALFQGELIRCLYRKQAKTWLVLTKKVQYTYVPSLNPMIKELESSKFGGK